MRITHRLALLLFVVLLATSTARAQEPVTPDSIAAERYFPLQIGNHWYYEGFGEKYERRVLRDTTVSDTAYVVMWNRTWNAYARPPYDVRTYLTLTRIGADGVRYVRRYREDGTLEPEMAAEPSMVYRTPLPVLVPLNAAINDTIPLYADGSQWGYVHVQGGLTAALDGRMKPYKRFYYDLPEAQAYVYMADIGEFSIGGSGLYNIPPAALVAYTVNGVTFGTFPTAVGGDRTRPETFALLPASPNPFNPTTQIGYDLSAVGRVRLEIFDALGRRVRTLVDETKPAGSYTATFDGAGLPSGLYLARLSLADGRSLTRRLSLVK